jgi:hypothetical protein
VVREAQQHRFSIEKMSQSNVTSIDNANNNGNVRVASTTNGNTTHATTPKSSSTDSSVGTRPRDSRFAPATGLAQQSFREQLAERDAILTRLRAKASAVEAARSNPRLLNAAVRCSF